MKKSLIFLITFLCCLSMSAQFEKGKKYLGANLNGLDLSFNNKTDMSFDVGANAGYMIEKDLLLLGTFDVNYYDSDIQYFRLGGKLRYFFDNCGIFVGAGANFISNHNLYDDFQVTAELGYCYFLNRNLTIEPSIRYDLGFSESGRTLGFAIELGCFF